MRHGLRDLEPFYDIDVQKFGKRAIVGNNWKLYFEVLRILIKHGLLFEIKHSL